MALKGFQRNTVEAAFQALSSDQGNGEFSHSLDGILRMACIGR